jgi:type VI secretion system protein ImpL
LAYTSLKKLQAIIGKETSENKSFWALYSGGIDFMQDYMMSESSCKLQDIWTNEFLTDLEGVPEYKVPGLAFGQEGLLWPFLENQLAPFVSERFGAGYVASKVAQKTYPINSDFLEFAARAKDGKQAKQAVYPVHLATLPSSTNLDSKYVIQETSIEMQCASGSTVLVNKNFSNSELFEWTESCSKVNLVINIGRFRLEYAYDGELGFPNFLDDFKTGQKRFTADDFPRESDRLKEAGISFMDIKYRIDGQNTLLQALKSKQISIPREIASCWQVNQSSLSASIAQ